MLLITVNVEEEIFMSNVKENTLKLLDYVKAFNDLKFKSKLDITNLHKIYFSKVPNLSDYIKVGLSMRNN